MSLRRVNDIGGEAYGEVERTELERAFWERHVDVIRTALGDDLCSVDEMRRGMEDLGPEVYGRLAFFERRLESIVNILVEKGVVDRQALEVRARELQEKGFEP